MPAFQPAEPTVINYDCAFTKQLLGTLIGTSRAQPNETQAEFKERSDAILIAFSAFAPRDPIEQMLAAQIVAANNASLDCMAQAMATDDPAEQARLHRRFAMLTRAARDTAKSLATMKARPADAIAPPPASIQPIAVPRRPALAAKAPQQPMHREKARPPIRDVSKMEDHEIEARMAELRARMAAAKTEAGEEITAQDPMHRDNGHTQG